MGTFRKDMSAGEKVSPGLGLLSPLSSLWFCKISLLELETEIKIRQSTVEMA